jgi:hypothetical protein
LIKPDERTEKNYQNLPMDELEELDDAESSFERAQRLALRESKNQDEINHLILSAAEQDHPVALAQCFLEGNKTSKDEKHAVSLLQQSASRGHVAGNFHVTILTN